MLTGAAEEHPYLFDVRRRRPFRALTETFVTGFQPSRFWSSVPLELRPVPRRLVLYCLILAALPTAALFTLGAQRVASKMWNRPAERLQLLQRVTVNNSWRSNGWTSAQALVDQVYPPIWSRKFNRETRDRVRDEGEGQVNALCATLAWPWLTLSALMLFRWSMRRARVRPAHVLRCCVYACDWAVLVPLALVAFVGRGVVRDWTNLAPSEALPIFAATIIGALTTYRLGVAYRTYLRFDRPFLTALAAQLIVVAFVWVVCLV